MGIGNHNTAEFWEYDTRTARRWNTDPVVKPWESSYAAFNGNPIAKTDIKGDDARVEKVPNANGQGGGTINISTTIHVTGKDAKDVETFVNSSNSFVSKMKEWGNTSGTYTDEDGQDWTINLNVNYVAGGTQDFADGDNTLDISKIYEGGRSKVNGGDKWTKETGWDYNTAGNSGTMRGGVGNLNYGFTSFHEGLHMLGLSDRYEENGYVPEAYKTDMMSGQGVNMHQNHWNNWGRAILQNPDSKFILRHRVDITGDEKMKYLQPENQATKRGTR